MLKGRLSKILAVCFSMLAAGLSLHAQDGAYTGFTPYSIYGIGDIYSQGSAYNAGMGGVGIATRNRRLINPLNPAAVTARDSLSFMMEMSVSQDNTMFRQGDKSTVNNTFNVRNITISVPLKYPYAAMMVGISPYSSTGYRYSYILEDPSIVGNTGNAVYYSAGKGGTYQLYAAAGFTFFKRLSLGVEGRALFGNIAKENVFSFAKSAYSDINSGYKLTLRGKSIKAGMQYEQPLGGGLVAGLGATYETGINLRGSVEDYRVSVGAAQNDTLRYSQTDLTKSGDVSIPESIGAGISLGGSDKWHAEINYLRSDWTKSGMDVAKGFAVKGSSSFDARVSQEIRAGFEIVPNRNDVRYYFKRCTYRFGAFYKESGFAVDANQIKDVGLTLGATLPMLQQNYNAVTFAVTAGQRSSDAGNLIRERYVNFTLGFNFHDMWFRKFTYR